MKSRTVTEKLLTELNQLRKLTYPNIGFLYWADVDGRGTYLPRVYVIINEQGGINLSALHHNNSNQRCKNIRQAITAAAHTPVMT
jgi:hypothetical protein